MTILAIFDHFGGFQPETGWFLRHFARNHEKTVKNRVFGTLGGGLAGWPGVEMGVPGHPQEGQNGQKYPFSGFSDPQNGGFFERGPVTAIGAAPSEKCKILENVYTLAEGDVGARLC